MNKMNIPALLKEQFTLSDNKIVKLEGLGHLANLTTLFLSGNPVDSQVVGKLGKEIVALCRETP